MHKLKMQTENIADKKAASWFNKSSTTSVRRNPIKCL